jgi:hypothetical protein
MGALKVSRAHYVGAIRCHLIIIQLQRLPDNIRSGGLINTILGDNFPAGGIVRQS